MTSEQTVVLRFRDHEVVIRGRNLQPVYAKLLTEEIAHLEESDVDWARESETFVDHLAIRNLRG